MTATPSVRRRVLIGVVAAAWGGAWFAIETPRYEHDHPDFAQAWYGARTMWAGGDPYQEVGPGRVLDMRWPLLYPATAFVVALPFAWLGELAASLAFVCVSSFVLGYAVTRRGYELLPLFASQSFIESARLAQWSTVLTAALFLPWLGFLVAAKPQVGLPVLAYGSRGTWRSALVGGFALLLISLLAMPSWPSVWFSAIVEADHLRVPLFQPGGFLLLLLLARWRRPESWLVLAMACVPQTWGWYNLLMLFAVASSFRQAAALAIASTVSYVAGPYLVGGLDTSEGFQRSVGGLQIATAYLPAMLFILWRPNEGELPAWLLWATALATRARYRLS